MELVIYTLVVLWIGVRTGRWLERRDRHELDRLRHAAERELANR